jgi:uncharacterized protein (TIGR00255 family)
MIRSMTGFASVSREHEGERASVTAKSVNHRFLDTAVKVPSAVAAIEGPLRSLIGERLTRGRIELSVSFETVSAPPRDVVLDEALLERVVKSLVTARTRGLVAGELTASDVLRIPGVLDIRPKIADAAGPGESLTRLLLTCAGEALDALVIMRTTEGRFLAADLEARVTTVGGMVEQLEAFAREGQAQLEARLRDRLAALPPDLAGDPASLAQEVVRFVARSDVDEELVRMRGHIEHWRALAAGPDPCGRKLDFLAQEMHREINTIGSKIEGARATALVIAAKAELERIREQVQNVE